MRAAVAGLAVEPGDLWSLLRERLSGELPSTSVKKAVRRWFPSPDYRYVYDGAFCLARQTPGGFLLEVRLDSPPHHAVLHGQVALHGPGYHEVFRLPEVVRDSQERVDAFAAACRRAADLAEAALDEKLWARFGPAPLVRRVAGRSLTARSQSFDCPVPVPS